MLALNGLPSKSTSRNSRGSHALASVRHTAQEGYFLTLCMRNLALTLENLGPGKYIWVIREGAVGDLAYSCEVDSAIVPFGAYADALRAGYERLASLVQRDRTRGPQIEVEESHLVGGATIPSQTALYRGRLIEAFCRKLGNGHFAPFVRVHEDTRSASSWKDPVVPFPYGGFGTLQEALDTAIDTGCAFVDGFIHHI